MYVLECFNIDLIGCALMYKVCLHHSLFRAGYGAVVGLANADPPVAAIKTNDIFSFSSKNFLEGRVDKRSFRFRVLN